VSILIIAFHKIDNLTEQFELLKVPACLVGRLYVANIFLWAGLNLLSNWYTTLYLFQSRYSTPFLNHEIAAILVTFSSIALSVLLAFGFYTRVSAAGLFILNLIGIVRLSEITESELHMHYIWGVILLLLLVKEDGTINLGTLVENVITLWCDATTPDRQ